MPAGIARQQEMPAGINRKQMSPGDNSRDARWRQLPVELLTAYMHCDRDRRRYPLACPGWEGFKTLPTRRRVDSRHQQQKDIEVMDKNETSEGVKVLMYSRLVFLDSQSLLHT